MSGESDDYDDGDVDGLVDKLEAAFGNWGGGDTMRVRARIEWNGETRGQRSTVIGGMDLNPVVQATAAAVAARSAWQSAARRRGPSDWHSQLKGLTGSAAGYRAADGAGLNVSRETLAKWLADPDYNVRRSDREKIAEANRSLFEGRAAGSRDRYLRAAHEAADALTEAVGDATGADVRFRDIDELEL